MNILLSLVLVMASSSMVVAKFQKSCSTSGDCEKDSCCYNGLCRAVSKNLCAQFEEKMRQEEVKTCFYDWECTDGCCIGEKCEPKSNPQCAHKKCDYNFDCNSFCCKNGRCQEKDSPCYTPQKFKLPTFSIPTINTDFLNKCSSNMDCYSSTKGRCCVDKHCGVCSDGKYIHTLSTTAPL